MFQILYPFHICRVHRRLAIWDRIDTQQSSPRKWHPQIRNLHSYYKWRHICESSPVPIYLRTRAKKLRKREKELGWGEKKGRRKQRKNGETLLCRDYTVAEWNGSQKLDEIVERENWKILANPSRCRIRHLIFKANHSRVAWLLDRISLENCIILPTSLRARNRATRKKCWIFYKFWGLLPISSRKVRDGVFIFEEAQSGHIFNACHSVCS